MSSRRPTSPGEMLRAEFMEPLSLTQQALADRLGVSRRRLNEILRDKRELTPDTAMRLARAFNTSPELWLNLQQQYELWALRHDREKAREYKKIKPIEQT